MEEEEEEEEGQKEENGEEEQEEEEEKWEKGEMCMEQKKIEATLDQKEERGFPGGGRLQICKGFCFYYYPVSGSFPNPASCNWEENGNHAAEKLEVASNLPPSEI